MKEKRSYLIYLAGAVVLATTMFGALFRPFINDEFHEAHIVYSLLDNIPYLDKLFYKNVLGYYLKLPFLLVFDSWWNNLILTRVVLGMVYSGVVLYAALKLRQYFSLLGIVCGTILLAFFTQNINHASAHRVDMLAASCGIFSLFAILDRRYIMAGSLSGLAFLMTQKGVFYSIGGFFTIWYATRSWKELRKFVLAGLVTGSVYILFWWCFAELKDILYTIFIKDTAMATAAGYKIRHYWYRSFVSNPVFWTTGAFSLAYLLREKRSYFEKVVFMYVSTLFVFCLMMGQSWPYFFILLTPFLYINVVDFFERILAQKRGRSIATGLVAIGLIFSIANMITRHHYSNGFQRYNIALLEQVLEPGETYLAGFNLHPKYHQAHPALEDLVHINRAKLKKLSPQEQEAIASELAQKPPKVIFRNARTDNTIAPVKKFIESHYTHLWANIYIYAHNLRPPANEKFNHYPGNYLVLIEGEGEAEINGATVSHKQTIKLGPGKFQFRTDGFVQLKLLPPRLPKQLKRDFFGTRSLWLSYDL